MNLPLSPRKRLGQHFLTDPRYCRRIVQLAGISAHDQVIEIGPGTGALTDHLLEAACSLTAVEIDDRSVEYLSRLYPTELETGQLLLLREDVLSLDWSALLDHLDRRKAPNGAEPETRPKLVANLPYNIATRLLISTTRFANRFHSLTVMTQKEVALRILSGPGRKEYGFLSVLMDFHYQRTAGFDVPPGAFTPRPKVVSHVLQLIPIDRPGILGQASYDDFVRIVSTGFSHRRKTLARNLQALGLSAKVLQEVFDKLSLDQKIRAEQVSLEGFISLSQMLSFAL